MRLPISVGQRRFFPVIHVRDEAQALRNVAIARQAGCDGVFLINHDKADGSRDLSFRELLGIHAAVVAVHPDWWVGVNLLDLGAADCFQHLNATVDGLWVDNAQIDERVAGQDAAQTIDKARRTSGWEGLYFGGVAFKYQRPISNPALAASVAADFMDVVMTSGAGTGISAELPKLEAMRQALPTTALGIASGISPENVDNYLPYIDVFLVATGISQDFYELDAAKTALLAKRIADFKG